MLNPQQENALLQHIMLKKLVDKMDTRSRAVIALIAAGFTQADTSKLLGISRSSVGSVYRKTLVTLRLGLENGDK